MGNMNPNDPVDMNQSDESGGSYAIFEPGTYGGTVTKVDMSKTSNGAKTKGATVLRVDSDFTRDDGAVTSVMDFMILHTNTIWKIKKFFRSVGLVDENQETQTVLPYNALVPGLKFTAMLGKEKYKNMSGEEKEKNVITNCLKPSEAGQTEPQQGGNW